MFKMNSLREMTRDELDQKKHDLVDEQFNLKMRRSVKQLDNPLRLRSLRRSIAQINTVLHEDEMGTRKLADQSTSVLGDSGAKKETK